MYNLFSRLLIFHVVKFVIYNVVFNVHGIKYILIPWIEYSVQLDAIFCFFCRNFASSISREKHQDVLIVTGYNDWKNLSGMARKHNSADSTLKNQKLQITKLLDFMYFNEKKKWFHHLYLYIIQLYENLILLLNIYKYY